ncbi:MAG: hypothetical protein AAGJ82_03830 [Bacteroidota bacterium]
MNNLNGLYIITEYEFDKELVEMVLPEQYQDQVEVISAGGLSSALSLTASILTARHQSNTILVVDADVNDPRDVEEKEDLICEYMRRDKDDERFALLIQRPEIEAVFFEDKDALESLTGRQFTDLEFELAKDNPKRNLLNFLSLPQEDKKQLLERARANTDVQSELKGSRLSQQLARAIGRFLS